MQKNQSSNWVTEGLKKYSEIFKACNSKAALKVAMDKLDKEYYDVHPYKREAWLEPDDWNRLSQIIQTRMKEIEHLGLFKTKR